MEIQFCVRKLMVDASQGRAHNTAADFHAAYLMLFLVVVTAWGVKRAVRDVVEMCFDVYSSRFWRICATNKT